MSKFNWEISSKQKHCHYCWLPFEIKWDNHKDKGRRPTRDHFIPCSKGGGNLKENIYIVCQYCNWLKGDFLPEEFIYWLSFKIRHEEFPEVYGVAYNKDLLKTIRKNVKAIYGNKPISITTPQYPTIKQINKAAKKLGADAHLSVNTNTIPPKPKEDWLTRYQNAPQQNFHSE